MATALRLYDTVDALVIVRAWLDEPENVEVLIQSAGDLDALPELRELLERAEPAFAEKVERVALVALEFKRTAETIGAEIDRLTKLRKAAETAERGLKNYLQWQLRRANVKRVDGRLAKVRVQANPPSVKSTLTPEQIQELHFKQSPFTVAVTTYTMPAVGVLAAFKDAIAELGDPPDLGSANYEEEFDTWRDAIVQFLRDAGVPEGVTVERGSHVRIA